MYKNLMKIVYKFSLCSLFVYFIMLNFNLFQNNVI